MLLLCWSSLLYVLLLLLLFVCLKVSAYFSLLIQFDVLFFYIPVFLIQCKFPALFLSLFGHALSCVLSFSIFFFSLAFVILHSHLESINISVLSAAKSTSTSQQRSEIPSSARSRCIRTRTGPFEYCLFGCSKLNALHILNSWQFITMLALLIYLSTSLLVSFSYQTQPPFYYDRL